MKPVFIKLFFSFFKKIKIRKVLITILLDLIIELIAF